MGGERRPGTPVPRFYRFLPACLLFICLVAGVSAYDFTTRAPTPATSGEGVSICTAILTITSTPSGATIYLDGVAIGPTPVNRVNVFAGQHTLRLNLAGYLDATDTFDAPCNQVLNRQYTLQQVPVTSGTTCQGILTVTSSPSGATLILDGSPQGTTPLSNLRVPEGQHDLRLTLTGFADTKDTVTTPCDLTISRQYSLQRVPVITTTLPTGKSTAEQARIPAAVKNGSGTTAASPGSSSVAEKSFPTSGGPTSPLALGQALVIHAGTREYRPQFTPLDPFFGYQVAETTGGRNYTDLQVPPTTILDIDGNNIGNLPGWISQGMPSKMYEGTGDMRRVVDNGVPSWSDQSTIWIRPENKTEFINLRWIADPDDPLRPSRGFWQVSREPFPINNLHWQNQYVPGLVGSGPVNELLLDSQGYHYFRINFATAANLPGGYGPYYDGIAYPDTGGTKAGPPAGILRIPVVNLGIVHTAVQLGFLSVPFPRSIITIPTGELTESEVGNPNENTSFILANLAVPESPADLATLDSLELQRDYQEFYLRLVPLDADGRAGIPTIPVKVFLKRPAPCPSCPPATTEIPLRLPSITVTQYYPPRASGELILSDKNGVPKNDRYYVVVRNPKNCLNYVPDLFTQVKGVFGDSFKEGSCPSVPCSTGNCPDNIPDSCTGIRFIDTTCQNIRTDPTGDMIGYHFVIHPPPPQDDDKPWYTQFYEWLQDPFGIVSYLGHYWDYLPPIHQQVQDYTIQSGEYFMEFTLWGGGGNLGYGQFTGLPHCKDIDWCHEINVRTHEGFCAYYNIPLTLPSYQELQKSGKAYLKAWLKEYIKQKISQGASKYSDDIQKWWDGLSPEEKQAIDEVADKSGGKKYVEDKLDEVGDKGDEYADQVVDDMEKQLEARTAEMYGTPDYAVPDYTFYTPHPAYLMFDVSNPNPTPSEEVVVTASDDQHYFYPASKVVPPLDPYDRVTITLLLEDSPVYHSLPAEDGWGGTNTFRINVSAMKTIPTEDEPVMFSGLENARDGSGIFLLRNMVAEGGTTSYPLPTDEGTRCQEIQSCSHQYIARFPPGWQVSYAPLSRDGGRASVDYTFTYGSDGFMGPGPSP